MIALLVKSSLSLISRAVYLLRTGAPFETLSALTRTKLQSTVYKNKYRKPVESFETLKSTLTISNDWFTSNATHWFALIDNKKLDQRHIEVLEIGSWEGLSSVFILANMKHAHLTCVDTWRGADEHFDENGSYSEILPQIEGRFDKNTFTFSDRLSKYKGTSLSFFADHPQDKRFDLIYIDGSHYSDDVLIDAIRSFSLLKDEGVMIFDDYFWKYYPKLSHNPAVAINHFLNLKQGAYEIISLSYQLIIQKTGCQATKLRSAN